MTNQEASDCLLNHLAALCVNPLLEGVIAAEQYREMLDALHDKDADAYQTIFDEFSE